MARIIRVRAWEVVVPARDGAKNSPELGSYLLAPGSREPDWDLLPICLLALETEDGITSLAEVGRGTRLAEISPWLAELPGCRFAGPNATYAPAGWRAGMLHGGLVESHPPAVWNTRLAATLEMAALDWAGKRLECRAADLLGGAYREEVAVDYWCGRKNPADLAATVAEAKARGFNGLKMKSRVGDPVIEQVEAIRAAGGSEFSLTIDPMFQWLSPHEALGTLRALERFGPKLRIEDPFPQDMPQFWQRGRQVCSVPLIWHARGLASLRRALQEGCADDYNCAGTAWEFLTYAHAVETAGHCCWRGSALELGVAQAAGLHQAAAARACTLASDFQSGFIREHTLVTWDWPYRNGRLPLPPGNGLGVELDMNQVDRYAASSVEYHA